MITYQDTTEGITVGMLEGFFQGWTRPRDPKTHLEILKNSDLVVLAVDSEKRKVVGFVTAITDHVQAAFIPLLEVLPDYQRQGIGTELMRRMLDRLTDVLAIDLTCDTSLQSFYHRLGMQPSVGMIIRRH